MPHVVIIDEQRRGIVGRELRNGQTKVGGSFIKEQIVTDRILALCSNHCAIKTNCGGAYFNLTGIACKDKDHDAARSRAVGAQSRCGSDRRPALWDFNDMPISILCIDPIS